MIRKILTEIRKGPTILTLSQIIDVIKSLQLLKVEEILKNEKDFLEILDLLVESYSDSAIFEVDNNNKKYLNRFSDGLRKLGKIHLIGKNKDDLNSYSDIFLIRM